MTPILKDRRAIAAVETALVISFLLLPMMALITGSGQALLEQYRIDRGLHSGLMYAWGKPTAPQGEIQSAATSGYGSYTPAMTAVASIACYCITAPAASPATAGTRAGGTTAVCGSTCPSGQTLGTWVTVTASTTFTPIFTLNWGSAAWPISATGTVRVQ